jgi:hypothetical protein
VRSSLRIKPDHPCLDHHPPRAKPTSSVALPASVATFRSKRGRDLPSPTARIEPPSSLAFAATPKIRAPTDLIGIAAGPSNRDLDLLQERLSARIDTRAAASRSSWADTEIVALISRHDPTIKVGFNARKISQTAIELNRSKAHHIERTAKSHQRTSRAPSLRRLKSLGKEKRRHPRTSWSAVTLPGHHAKNQCADKHFTTAGMS